MINNNRTKKVQNKHTRFGAKRLGSHPENVRHPAGVYLAPHRAISMENA